MTTREVLTALRRHHRRMNTPWVVLREAFGIDALALSQARGQTAPHFRRVAYEVKVSRGDFRRELDRWPHKAQLALDVAHAFYFVVPAGMLKKADLVRDMPSQLRVAGTARRGHLWIPRPAGLLEVDVDGVCRIRMRPDVTDARPWTEKEVAYIAAYAHRPGVIATAEWKNYDLKDQIAKARYAEKTANETTERATARLADLGAALVQPGSRWRVNWLSAPHVKFDDPRRQHDDDLLIECEVIEVIAKHGRREVLLRRCDGPEENTTYGPELGRFLLESERATTDGKVVPLRRGA